MSNRSEIVVRQGDVVLIAADLPGGAAPLPASDGKVIVAFGEATGHHHRFEGAATLYADGARRYVRVDDDAVVTITPIGIEPYDDRAFDVREADGSVTRLPLAALDEAEAAIKASATLTYPGAKLRHEEHSALVVAPGAYALPGQREYTSADMAPLPVQD